MTLYYLIALSVVSATPEQEVKIRSKRNVPALPTTAIVLIGALVLLIMALPGIQAVFVLLLLSGPIIFLIAFLLLGLLLPGIIALLGVLSLFG
jgi:fatty acid desaturase